MQKHHPENERIKRQYLIYLKEAMGQSESTLDSVAAAIARFEIYTGHRSFKHYCQQQAVAFKRQLADRNSAVTGTKLSKATLYSTLSNLKRFFHWLAGQPGYKSRFAHADANYFNVSEKDARIATARRYRPVPTLEQVRHVVNMMAKGSDIERRNRALLAFAILTGARDGALASAKLKHVDIVSRCFYQDAREVKTKFSKTFNTHFFPVGDDLYDIVADWVRHLREVKLWGNDDPLFPKTLCTQSKAQQFEHVGLAREHWSTASPIRQIFRQSCVAAGLPYFNPHSLRNMLAMIGEKNCKSIEDFKAWSQNLGHDGVLTTLVSYGTVSDARQREILQKMANQRGAVAP